MQHVVPARLRQFFATVPVPCPYLPELSEQKLVIDMSGPGAESLYSDLSRAGFRRSHALAYRPTCKGCSACVPVRIRVETFCMSRSLRRVARRNADLAAAYAPPRATDEQFRLFRRYQHSRHGSSDMASMTFGDYRAMVEETPLDTRLVEFRDGAGALRAACLIDLLDDALSAVYSFFEPDEPRRSLGTHTILWLVERAHRDGRPFVYLGYWIAGSRTMDYKRRFPALEQLRHARWEPLPPLPD